MKSELRKIKLTVCMLLSGGISASAAGGDGGAGIDVETQMLRSYFDKGVNLMYVLAALIGLIGAIKVYSKWSSGDPDTMKVAAGWFGACVFLAVSAAVIRSFFL